MTSSASLTPRRATHLFAIANIAFLGVDIAIAHLANAFARRAEWAPIYFSVLATLLLLPGAFGASGRAVVLIDRAVAWMAIIMGVLGMVLHLRSGFFETQTLHYLVYSAPFVAPLSYVGVGALLLLVRSTDRYFGDWVLVLALGGFIGNFALSIFDHEQNGLFHLAEWIPVGAAALAIGYLIVELARPIQTPLWFAIAVLSTQVIVALVGFALHVRVDIGASAARPIDRFVFGAPAFAPLLFADLAILAALGLWAGRSGVERLEQGLDIAR